MKEHLSIVIVGHVDHGKSTLVGRLFHDTDSLPDGKYEQVLASCNRRGMQFEWSFLMDALQSERDQEITIDTSQIWFRSQKRDYVIIDAPGHKEFLKNMISGAANSEAALLLIDAKEGVREQSKRHGYLLHLLGVNQVSVVVNKMDLVDYSQERFDAIEAEYRAYLKELGVEPKFFVPISARNGDNMVNRSEHMDWYKGPTIVESLDSFSKKPVPTELPLRMPIQDVYRFDEHKRIFAGRIESGRVKVGDELLFSPSNKTAKVKSLEFWGKEGENEAYAGMCPGITLEDQIFAERGEVISLVENPPLLTNLLRARLFWLDESALSRTKRYTMKITTSSYKVEVREIEQVLDTDSLSRGTKETVERHDVAEVVFHVRGLAAIDPFTANPTMGRFMLMDGYRVVGGGILSMEGFTDQRVAGVQNIFAPDGHVTKDQRALINGHEGGVIWLNGYYGSGKNAISKALEKRLFAKGYHVVVLDQENIDKGLNKDLDLTHEGRSEAIRRVGEVAGLMAKSGMIVISALMAPYSEDRRRIRNMMPESFHSVFLSADIDACRARDTKGVYAKADKGDITLPGVNADFEVPENADLIIDTGAVSVDEAVSLIEHYIERQLIEPVKAMTDIGGGI